MPSRSRFQKAAGALVEIGLLLCLLFAAPIPSFAVVELDGFVINADGTAALTGEVYAAAVQPWDGKILIGGNFTLTERVDVTGPVEDFKSTVPGVVRHHLARLNNDGTVDTAFAPEPDDPVKAILIEQDKSDPTKPGQSRIYIGGDFDNIAGVARYGLARLRAADGVPDSFAPAAAGSAVYAMVLQANRRVVVGGDFTTMDGTPCSNLAAISIAAGSDGTLLQTFAGGTDGAVHALLLQDGYLVAGGEFTTPKQHLARFDPGDLLDGAFSAEPGGVVRALALQPDAMILVGGDFTTITTSLTGNQPRQYLARLTGDGKLDSFNALLEPFEPAGVNQVATIAVQPDGKIMAAGRFTRSTADPLKPQHHLARFTPDGTFDPKMDTATDEAINVIALEPNGRFLIGGKFTSVATALGVRSRTMLARFYFHGGIDDDGAPFPSSLDGAVISIALRPDGTVTIGGITGYNSGKTTVAKLNPDLSHDPSFAAGLWLNEASKVQSLMPDGKLLVGGWFTSPRQLYVQLTETGAIDEEFQSFLDAGPALLPSYSWGGPALVLPRVIPTTRPVGTMNSEGMMYLAVARTPLGGTDDLRTNTLVRVTASGALDEEFTPVTLNGNIGAIALLEDGKILVGGGFTKKLIRLHSNGEEDTTFRPWYPAGNEFRQVVGITLQRDGKIIINGPFDYLHSPDNVAVFKPRTAIARLNSDGTVDDTFNITLDSDSGYFVQGVCQLNDESLIIFGMFSTVNDGSATHARTCVTRLSKDGKVIGTNPLYFYPAYIIGVTLANVVVQPDGKLLIGGDYNNEFVAGSGPLYRWTSKYLTRVSNEAWATEELVVAPDGSEIAWHRGGTGPAPWHVWFEEKSEVDTEWKYLGPGVRSGGVWKISLPPPEEVPKSNKLTLKQNRYVRARGYSQSTSINTASSTLLESVRQYYLKEPIRVRADPVSREYGQGNPAGYAFSYFDASGAPIVPAAGTYFGTPTFSTTRTPTSPVGNHAIAADVSGMSSPIYSFIPDNGTFTVTKRPASVEPADITRVYGQPFAYSGTLSGFLPGDNVTASYSHTGGNTVTGSPHTISAALQPAAALGNYDITYGTGDLIFTKKDALVRPDNLTRVYGDPAGYTGTLQGFLPGDNVTATYSHAGGNTVAGSPHTISATLEPAAVLGNYNITYETGNLTFTKKDASVTPADLTRVYGDPVVLTGTLEGFLPGDVTATYSRVAGNSVSGSPYTITATLEPAATLANYNITYRTGNLTFTKRAASVTPHPGTKVYGSTAAELLTGTLNGFLAGDGVSASYSRVAGETVAGSPYAISATLTPSGALDNYDITYGTADFTITRKAASVTPNPASKEYGSTAAESLTGVLSGFLAADNVMAAYSRTPGNTVVGGPYPISATLSPAGVLGNYDITYNSAAFTITKKPASVTPNPASKEYGSTAAESLTGVLSGFLAADNVMAAYSRVAGNTVVGGPYPISATLSPAGVLGNYDITYNSAGFTITKKAASVTPDPASKEYGSTAAENLTGTVSGFLAADNVTAAYSRVAGNTVTGGPYSISATLSPAGVLGNYDITYNTANFTVTKRAASVTPNPASKEYGSTAAENLTGTVSGFLAADNVTAAYSRVAGNTVTGGPYTISATLSPAGVLGNYDITYNTANFTVTKRAASVTPNPAAKEYGTAAEDLTGILSGFVESDGVTATYSRVAGDTVAGSPYSISATLGPAGVLGNYDITYNNADFTITKKAASVTPNPAGKEYGSTAAEVLTGTLSGFLATDNVTAAYSRGGGNTVAGSPYVISATLSPAGVLGNYDITYNSADFTITKKAASVTPNPAGKEYGSTAAENLTGTVSGFLATDNVTAAYSRVAGDTVVGSPYTISATLSPAGVLGNYDITYNNADFTITKKAASVTPNPATKVYGVSDPAFSGTLSGFLAADNVTATYSRNAGNSVAGGPYTISATLSPAGVLGNYDITYNSADFTITKKAASATPNPATKVYGSSDPAFSGTLSGFLAADNVTATYSRNAGNSVAGSPYSISATLSPAGVLGNYDITYNSADFTITKKTAWVTPDPVSREYGATAAEVLTGTLNGFLESDGVTATYSREAGGTVAGSPYTISATLSPAGVLANYDITYNTAYLSIGRKAASVTPNPATKVYGSTAAESLTGTLSGFLDSDNVSAIYSRTAGESVAGSPYTIGATLSPAGALQNYDITYNTAPFNITRKAASVTPSPGSKVYGTAGPDPLAGTLSGFLPADGVTATYSRAPGETVAGSPYAITATLAPDAALGNYDITYGAAGFTILRKPASVTPTDAMKEYGSPDPETLTGSLSGFLPADGVTASYTRTPGETSAGSPYTISATLSPAAVLGNYDVTYHSAGFVIGKKQATVTAVAASKRYGEADPPLSAEGSGFLPADCGPGKVTLTSSRVPGDDAGSYLLTPDADDSGTGLLGNYNLALVPGTLTILKAPLTITAENKSRIFGAPNPEFTATYSGFAGSDTAASLGGTPAFTTTAGAASPAGSYPIVPAIGTITSTNYNFTFVSGILTVLGSAPQSITFNPMRPKTYGDGDFDPGAQASSNLAVSYASSNPAIAAVVGERIRVLAPGNAEITASQGGNEIFAAAEEVTRGLVVNPPPWNGAGFDGSDDFIEVADGPQLDFGSKSGFTIETWLYLDGPQPDGTGLLSKGEGGDPWSGYQLILHRNRIAAEIGAGTVTVGAAEGLAGTSDLADGAWHHVALTVDRAAATAKLYLDGRVEAEITHAALAGNQDNAAPLLMGRERTGTRFFKGRIDELRLWDTTRSRDEIRASVSQIIDPLDEPHLVAYFHLDEGDVGLDNGAFATAPERTGFAANGTLRNFALTGGDSNWIRSGAFLPLLETSAAGSITSDGASAGGTVYPNYYPATETGLCWGTSANPDESDSCRSYGGAGGSFSGALTGLNPGTTYHLRGYARNQVGTAYGNDVVFQTAKLDQTISFDALEERTYGEAAVTLTGSSSSGLTLAYTSSDAGVAELVGDQLRIRGAGTATITAWQGGNAIYNAAVPVSRLFTVQKKPVTVTADDKSRAYLAENPLLTARYQGILAGEEGAVTGLPLLSTTAARTSPVGSYPITVGAGTLSAANYRFVLVDGVLTVGRAAQQITFNPMRAKTFGDRDFDPGATASSDLPVAYATSAPGIAAVAGNRLKVVAPGTAAITASQAGSREFYAASDVTRELVVNPPPWNGLGFDGVDDILRVPDAPQLAFGDDSGFTVEGWLQLDGAQQDGTGVVSKGEGGSAGLGFNLLLHQNRLAAEIGYGAGSVAIAEGLIGSSSLNDGQWHHVALSVDRVAATASLYLDGRLEARIENPLLGGSFDNPKPLQIGVERNGSRFFRGRIDEVRLWSAARSRDEIRESVSQIIDPLDFPDLVAYFHLDEGDAALDNVAFATAPERTTHAADGTLIDFALSGAGSNWVRSGAFLPLLETAPVTLITSSAATGGGVVYPNYYPATDYGLCWSSAPNPTLADSCSHSGSGTGPYVGLMAGLTPGVTYHARGFATNRMGTAYGNEITFQAARLDQSITFGPIGERTYGDSGFALAASASSLLPVSYTSSDPTVAVVENGMIVPRRAGRTTITARQGGNRTYNAAAAVSQPFVVNKKQLTVSADAKSRAYRTPNPTFTVSYQGFVAGEGSGVISGAPQLSSVASLDSPVGSYPIVVGLGTLSADNYRFVAVNGTLSVFQSCQEIIFPPIGDRTYGDPPVGITASACSGLNLSFASSNPLVATVTGNVLTITGAGSSVITASQGGNGDLEQAPKVSQTLVVHKRGQVITFPPLPQKVLGDAPLSLDATASSGLPVTYYSSDPAVAAVNGSTVAIAGAGTAVITARQEGSGNYHPALPASQPLTVALEGTLPTLRLSALPSGSATASPVINVTGSAQDDSGITSLKVNDAELTVRGELFSSAVPLAVGDNSITVTAKDGAGNVASETLSVTLDATAPVIAVAEPADNSVADQSLFSAKGTVPAGSAVTMTVNGIAPQSLAVTSGTFIGTGYLQPGLNTIELKAQLSGRSAVAKRSVTLATGTPALAITEPGEDLRTEADFMVVKGRVGTETGATVEIEVNGATHAAPVEGGTFEQQVAMDRAGEYRVTVTATDGAGQSSSAQRNIIKVDRIPGDLDRDGVVDIGDAIALLRISLGIDPATGEAVARGDVAPIINGVSQPDGKIGVGDVLVLLRRIVGLID